MVATITRIFAGAGVVTVFRSLADTTGEQFLCGCAAGVVIATIIYFSAARDFPA